MKADYVLANPPFNDSDWGGDRLREDVRWKFGTPPSGNANFAWVQHFIHHLAPNGIAGFVLANGSMSSNQSVRGRDPQGDDRADLVDCMVALTGQLFYSTAIPVCLWFLARNERDKRVRSRPGETLFIHARKLGTLVDRVHRELTEGDIQRIAGTYHAWRGDEDAAAFADLPGFCLSAKLEDIQKHGYVLTPGRYVGAADVADDEEPFEAKIERLTKILTEQMEQAHALDRTILANLVSIGQADKALRDLCEAVIDCPHSTPVWTDRGVIVLRNQNIRHGRLDLSQPSFTDEEHYKDRTRRAVPRPGDLVITREAPMGEVCLIPSDVRCCLGQSMVLLRPNRAITDPQYLLYALQSKSVQHEIRASEGTGSTGE